MLGQSIGKCVLKAEETLNQLHGSQSDNLLSEQVIYGTNLQKTPENICQELFITLLPGISLGSFSVSSCNFS